MMMIPEPWSDHESMSAKKKAFYEYHALPDGAVGRPGLDRLHRRHADRRHAGPQRPAPLALLRDQGRPGRDGLRGRRARHPRRARRCRRAACSPGRMFLVDTAEGRIIADEEIKHSIATAQPYGQWLRENLVTLEDLPEAPPPAEPDHETVLQRQQAFGYTPRGPGACSWRPWPRRRRAGRLHGQRHAAGRALRPAAARSTTTSSSSSPRSPTRPSTRSAKRSSWPSTPPSAPRATCSSPTPESAAPDQARHARS